MQVLNHNIFLSTCIDNIDNLMPIIILFLIIGVVENFVAPYIQGVTCNINFSKIPILYSKWYVQDTNYLKIYIFLVSYVAFLDFVAIYNLIGTEPNLTNSTRSIHLVDRIISCEACLSLLYCFFCSLWLSFTSAETWWSQDWPRR